MNIIERVARALCCKTNIAMEGQTTPCFDHPDHEYMAWVQGEGFVKPTKRWRLYVPQAEAAISAVNDAINDDWDADLQSSIRWFWGRAIGNNNFLDTPPRPSN